MKIEDAGGPMLVKTFFPITIQLKTGEIKTIHSPYEIEKGWEFKVLEYSRSPEQ